MKILIITQTIDERDPVLGFMCGWIAEFAKHCERVTAIGLSVGEHRLPANVRVLSLGKPSPAHVSGALDRLRYAIRSLRYIVMNHREYDAVFVHMNPEYIVLGGVPWKFFGKKVGLWFAHKSTPFSLRLALPFCDVVFTSTESGFRIPTNKLRIVGQGIDTERFAFVPRVRDAGEPLRIVMVARISPIKDLETLIRSLVHAPSATLEIVGAPAIAGDEKYLSRLKDLAEKTGVSERITFAGAVSNAKIGEHLSRAHLFVNTSRTGSFDKAVGEAMATGLPVLTSNEAFREVFPPARANDLLFPPGDDAALGKGIGRIAALSHGEYAALGHEMRSAILGEHALERFVGKILRGFETNSHIQS